MTTARLPLKDQLFTREKVELIAGEIKHVDSAFKADEFVTMVVARFPELELKARIAWITTCLERHLPRNFRKAASALVRSLPAPADPALSDGDFGDFIYAPYAEYVAQRGCTAEDLEFSLAMLRAITTRFSAEFAIRPFLDAFPDHVLTTLLAWTGDPELALDTLERWRDSGLQQPREMHYVIRHGARTLRRADHPRARDLVSSPLT